MIFKFDTEPVLIQLITPNRFRSHTGNPIYGKISVRVGIEIVYSYLIKLDDVNTTRSYLLMYPISIICLGVLTERA